MRKNMGSLLLAAVLSAMLILPAAAAAPSDWLMDISYYGDRSACRMTAQQAEAFASVIRSEAAKRTRDTEAVVKQNGSFRHSLDNQAAFADAGSGMPVMLFFSNLCQADGRSYDGGYNTLWYWNGEKVVRFVPTADWVKNGWDADALYLHLYPDHVLACSPEFYMTGQIASLAVFPFQNGRVASAPSTTAFYENGQIDGVLRKSFLIDGKTAAESQAAAWMEKNGDGYVDDQSTRVLAGYRYIRQGAYNVHGLTSADLVLFVLEAYAEDAATAGFKDVLSGIYYAEPVAWAVSEGITDGTSPTTFSPDADVTRGQAVTFLWRAAGRPSPRSTLCPFSDVKPSDYCYEPVLWAMEQGITNGTGPTAFSPNAALTRGHIVTFLWRTAGRPGETGTGTWYEDAVRWGEKNALLAGTAADFAPEGRCPRSDVVTYLYRADKKGVMEPGKPSYDFVLDNCSWTDAFQKAKDAGGHLVRIETRLEYETILAEIDRRGMDFAEFRVGARRDEDQTDYYWMDNRNRRTGRALNDALDRIGARWDAGEPSFQWGETPETVLEFYRSGEDWVWNDMADRPDAGPSDCCGYIIEY